MLRLLAVNPKVVGALTPAGAMRAEVFYRTYLGAPVTNVGSLEAAEFAKLAGMVYRDVNIALANELAHYSQMLGLAFDSIRSTANTDGEANLLQPGIGVGGHCTPVYPYFLIRDASTRGIGMALATSAREINETQPSRVLARAGSLRGKRVVILGLGFRPQVKETAYSPAFALQSEIKRLGGVSLVHDPLFSDSEIQSLGFVGASIESADVLVLNTAHDYYRELDFSALAKAGVKVIVDGRDIWDSEAVRAAGLQYIGVGNPSGLFE
jgi:nucleotide sugar dehydrogenase